MNLFNVVDFSQSASTYASCMCKPISAIRVQGVRETISSSKNSENNLPAADSLWIVPYKEQNFWNLEKL